MRRLADTARTLAFAAILGAAGLTAAALDMPNLTGTWQLDRDASDDPQKVMKEARPSASGSGAPGGGRHGGGGRSGGGSGMGHASGGGRPPADDGAPAPDPIAMTALDTLTIRHEEPRITITDASGRERVVYTDGRRTQEERSHGGTTQVTARWKEARVEIVSTPQTGPTVTESFAVAADGSTLTVVMKIEGGRAGPVTIRRVYGAVKPALPVAPASPPKEPGGGAGSSPPA